MVLLVVNDTIRAYARHVFSRSVSSLIYKTCFVIILQHTSIGFIGVCTHVAALMLQRIIFD